MQYEIYDMDGTLVSKGYLDAGMALVPDVPTHGSISLKVGDCWLNIRTSESMDIDFSKIQRTWKSYYEG